MAKIGCRKKKPKGPGRHSKTPRKTEDWKQKERNTGFWKPAEKLFGQKKMMKKKGYSGESKFGMG